MLGALDDAYLYAILERVASRDAQGLIATAEEMRSRSVAFEGALQDLASLLHRVALAQAAPETVEPGGNLSGRLAALAKALAPEDVQLFYQIVIHGRQDLPFAPDDFAGFTMALLRMLAFAAEERPPAQRVEKPAAGSPRQGGFDGDWPRLANALNLGGVAKQLAQASELQRFDGESLELCVPPAAKHLAEKSFQDKLRGALQEHFGKPVRLSVRVGETGGNTARDRAAAAISQDTFVRDLVENFDATIVESSIKPAQ
jgi:DNA polymerase-3 subunit gamma/tau